MSSGKRKLLITVCVIVGCGLVLATIGTVFRPQIGARLLQEVAQRQAGRDVVADLSPGLHLALCGTGSPLPDPSRAGPCNAIIAGGKVFLVDAGEGASANLSRMGIPAGRIEAVFLTHFHSDHIDGLGGVLMQRWVAGSHDSPVPVVGPEGVESVVDGFDAAYTLDNGYRTSHHGEAIAPPSGAGGGSLPFSISAAGAPDGVVVYQAEGLTVRAFSVDHGPVHPAVGYRFDYQGRSVVISGDTVRSDHLIRNAKGADILVHDALQPRLLALVTNSLEARHVSNLAQVMRDIVDYHATPEQAAETAQLADVGALVLSHVVPPQPLRYGYAAFMGDAPRRFDGPVTVGEDGMLFSLPPESVEIRGRRML
jgi:ribonuclease Z